MRLNFNKKDDTVEVIIVNTDGKEFGFSYTKMIELMYEEKSIEDSEIEGDFTVEESSSIVALTEALRNVVTVVEGYLPDADIKQI